MEQNYLPLFRKYRPQSFKDIVGQESLVKALTNAIELNRIANAYLFCGPRGTGKTSTARILAKSLNCEKGPTIEPCQKCPSCVDITNASGLDVIEIDAASNRGIQDAKDLISQVQYAPINGKYKIFIIDEVHMLSNDAFNALLKTFEEPPKNVIFILATTEPHKVLETIVSRCQRFDLRRITTQDIVKRLREISDIEQIKITDEALFTIAKNVSGGLRDSLALLDQVSILGAKEEITKEHIEELLGKINFDVLLNLLKDIYSSDIEHSLADVNNIYSKGNEPRNLAENFIEFLRNVTLVLSSSEVENIKNFTTLIDEDIAKIKSCEFENDKIIKILNVLIEYYKEIKVSTNPYLWMELAVIGASKLDLAQNTTVVVNKTHQVQPIQKPVMSAKAAAMEIQKPIEAQPVVANNIEIIEQTPVQPIEPKIEPKIEQKIEQAPQIQPISPEIAQNQDSAQIWANILGAIKSVPTRALFTGVAKLVGINDNKLVLGFLNDTTLNQAKTPNKYSMLENAMKATYPHLSFEFKLISKDTKVIETRPTIHQQQAQQAQAQRAQSYNQPAQNPQVQNQIPKPEKIEDEEENLEAQAEKKNYSPEVQEMLEQFSGRIIE